MDLETLKLAIARAFDGVTIGDGIGLWEAQAIDDYETDLYQVLERRLQMC